MTPQTFGTSITHIGNNYSRSTYTLDSSVSLLNESLWIVNTTLYFSGNLSISIMDASFHLLDSAVMPENLASKLEIAVQSNSMNSGLYVFNSSVNLNGRLSVDNSAFTAFRSTFGSRTAMEYVLNGSRVTLVNSSLRGLSNRTMGEIPDGNLIYDASPLSSNVTVPLSVHPGENRTLINMIKLNISYSGNNPLNGSYLVFHAMGVESERVNFPNTGSATLRKEISVIYRITAGNISAPILYNASLKLIYDGSGQCNSTLWGVNITLLTNDSVNYWGEDAFDLVLLNSTIACINSSIPLRRGNWYSEGKEINPHKRGTVLMNSTAYLVSASSSYGNRSFGIDSLLAFGNSTIDILAQCRIVLRDNGGDVNQSHLEIGPYVGANRSIDYNTTLSGLVAATSSLLRHSIGDGPETFTVPVSEYENSQMDGKFLGDSIVSLYNYSATFSVNNSMAMDGHPLAMIVNMTMPVISVQSHDGYIDSVNGSFTCNITDSYMPAGMMKAQLVVWDHGRFGIISEENLTMNSPGERSVTFRTTPVSFPPGAYNITLDLLVPSGSSGGNRLRFVFPTVIEETGGIQMNTSISLSRGTHFLHIWLANRFPVSVPVIGVDVVGYGNISIFRTNLSGVAPGETVGCTVSLANLTIPQELHVTLALPSFYLSGGYSTNTTIYYDPVCAIDFHEAGILGGQPWALLIAGRHYETMNHDIRVNVSYGQYECGIVAPQGYYFHQNISFLADSPELNLTMNFTRIMYKIVVVGMGIPIFDPFYMACGGATYKSYVTYLNMSLPPGTYSFLVWGSGGYSPDKDTMFLNVTSTGYLLTIQFSKITGNWLQSLQGYTGLLDFLEIMVSASAAGWFLWRRRFSHRIDFGPYRVERKEKK